jgi:uncharacterized protein YjbI with pentapeptide repeats
LNGDVLFLADKDHLEILKKGVDLWNKWREENPSIKPDLSGSDFEGAILVEADLSQANLSKTNLGSADLSEANLFQTDLGEAKLNWANLAKAYLGEANLTKSDLSEADLTKADLTDAKLTKADLAKADLIQANLSNADLTGANLAKADLSGANLSGANLANADISEAKLLQVNLYRANLTGANLSEAKLNGADLVETNLVRANLSRADMSGARVIGATLNGATLTDCRVFGISAWGLKGSEEAQQSNLLITAEGESEITVDNLEVAQFIYLMLHGDKIRGVINTIGQKGVLILGRFSERKYILEGIKTKLRDIGYVPIVFDFERPVNRDFTETVMTLAGMSRFIIADITQPKSVPLELQATVPDYMIPMVTIIEKGEKPFSMFRDLWIKYRDWVLEPLAYDSIEQLQRVFQKAIVDPANNRLLLLRAKKAEKTKIRDASDYE